MLIHQEPVVLQLLQLHGLLVHPRSNIHVASAVLVRCAPFVLGTKAPWQVHILGVRMLP
jgi:hypothetical protein